MSEPPVRVVIHLSSRNPKESIALMEGVRSVFQPRKVEIKIDEIDTSDHSLPDEQVEAKLTERIEQALDRRAKKAKKRKSTPGRAKRSHKEISSWVKAQAKKGWKVLSKLVPFANEVKDLFFN